MTETAPQVIKTRSGNAKATRITPDKWSIERARSESAPLGKIEVDPKIGDAWFYPEKAFYQPHELRDIVYLMDRVGRK